MISKCDTRRRPLFPIIPLTTLASVVITVLSLATPVSCAGDSAAGVFDPAKEIEAEFPYAIDFVFFSPQSGQFSPGDAIVVTSVRGDRRHIEPNGRYLIEGDYTLSSMESADLGLHARLTGRAPIDIGDLRAVSRGSGHFTLRTSMISIGPFPISFIPTPGGDPRGAVFLSEVSRIAYRDSGKNGTGAPIVVGINNDGWISVYDKFVPGDQLEQSIGQAHAANPESPVVIKVYDRVGVDRVKFVMDVCRGAGITNVELQRITVVGIDEKGAVSFNHVGISDAELNPLLIQVRNIDLNSPVLVVTNEGTPLNRLAYVMDACRAAGLRSFSSQSH